MSLILKEVEHSDSAERLPESGERCSTASRILKHPPVPQPVEHFGACPGALGCTASNFGRADVGVLGSQDRKPGSSRCLLEALTGLGYRRLAGRTVEQQDRPTHLRSLRLGP